MTDEETREISKKIGNLTTTVASGFATLNTQYQAIKESHDRVSRKVDEMKTAQDSCVARGSVDAVNARLKRIEKKSSEDRIHVESGFRSFREDQTGNIEESLLRKLSERPANGNDGGWLKSITVKALPYIVLVLVLFGAWMGSGGDEERTRQVIQNLREIAHKVERIENNREPVRIPVPVTPAECVSKEAMGK